MARSELSLRSTGLITGVAHRADQALQYFYIGLYSQTDEYRGLVRPLSYLCREYGDNPYDLRAQVEQELINYLRRLFDDAVVVVEQETVNERIHLRATIDVIEDGVRYNVGHLIRTNGLEFEDVIDFVNDGIFIKR